MREGGWRPSVSDGSITECVFCVAVFDIGHCREFNDQNTSCDIIVSAMKVMVVVMMMLVVHHPADGGLLNQDDCIDGLHR